MIKLYNGDCLELMKDITDKSIDMICCDLPYGILNRRNPLAKWDSVISFEKLWEQYKRIIKDNGAIVLFGSGMFTADLMVSNKSMWRYNLVWKKGKSITGFLNAKKQPLRNHEDICVFSKGLTTYNPQMTVDKKHIRGGGGHRKQSCYGTFRDISTAITSEKYPISIIDIKKEGQRALHPTQKPVALLEWLVKTYTNEGETVLDNCMGSGSCGVACVHINRNFIGIEKDEKYFELAKERIENCLGGKND